MRLAKDKKDQQRWMQQWRQAAVAMAEQRQKELAGKRDEENLAIIDALLSLPTAHYFE